MTCCIVGILLTMAFARLRRATGFARLGRNGARPAPAPVLFAPVARRPAPGQELPAAPDPQPAAPAAGRSPVLDYCAIAITAVLLGVPVLAGTGVLHGTGSAGQWAARSAVYAAAAVAAVALRTSAPIWRAPRGVGTLLIVAGAVVFELGVLDMHVFRVVAVDPGNPLALFAFHNVGPALAIAGGAVLGYGSLGRSITSWRPSRSTVSSATPSSSAVTVSSAPPLTV